MTVETNRLSKSEKTPAQPALSAALEVAVAVSVSVLLLIPCLWLDHIEAGDLSSHVYNAWLATQIKSGAIPGLAVVHPWTNTLTDLALEALPRLMGPGWTEKVVVGAAVLIFFWGAFCAVTIATGRRAWLLAPSLGMLAYGLIFHLGFLNYYLSTGLCLWALALLWRPSRRRILQATPVLLLATLAHALPVVWVIAVLGYLYLSRRFGARQPWLLPVAGAAALGLLHAALIAWFPARWSLDDLINLGGLAGVTGVDQVWLFGRRYLLVMAGLLWVWLTLFLQRIDRGGFLRDPVAQLWLLHLLAFVLMPTSIQFPQYQHVLAYIPQRISLLGALFLCLTVGGAAYGRGVTRLSAVVAAIFFVFLYLDDRAFNVLENEVADLVQTLPPGQRVVAAITDSDTRLNAPVHVVDRACVGHCFSYADYEPATGQFRIRIVGPNKAVAPNMTVVQDIENGSHIVTPAEAPLYSICLSDDPVQQLVLRALHAGERTCSFSRAVSPRLF